MRVFSSSTYEGEAIKFTRGQAHTLHAVDEGAIYHTGSARRAIASHAGLIVISKELSDLAHAREGGVIYAHGDTETVSIFTGGTVFLAGNPRQVAVTHSGHLTVFGEPKEIALVAEGTATVVSLDEDYMPDSLKTDDETSLRLITPMFDGQYDGSYLVDQLDQLYSPSDRNAKYAAYLMMLSTGCQEEYIPNPTPRFI